MRKIKTICFLSIIFCFLFSLTSFSSNNDLFTNIEFLNGHDWVEMSEEEKIFFVRGFVTGFNMMHISFIAELDPKLDIEGALKELKDQKSLLGKEAIQGMIETFNDIYGDEEKRDMGILQIMLEI